LPSNETYEVLNDKNGRIWFTSNNGVGYYKNGAFKYFNSYDGLTDNTVFKIYEDDKERIWFSTFNHMLSYFKNDSIYPYLYNDSIEKYIPPNLINIGLVVDKNYDIHLGYKTVGYFKLDSDGVVTSSFGSERSPLGFRGYMEIDDVVLTFGHISRSRDLNNRIMNYSFYKNDFSNKIG
jgi:hypothetical protein